jgi:hypothetical protein
MSLRIRRGTDAQRQTALLDQGELAYTTDTQRLYIGDGATTGGVNVLATAAGTGLIFDQVTQTLKVSGSNTVVEADTAPSLGGNLNLNGRNITGTGNIGNTGTITLGGSLIIGTNSIVDGSGRISLKSSNTPGERLDLYCHYANGSGVDVPQINIKSSKGTIGSPATTVAGDIVGAYSAQGYTTAYGFVSLGAIAFKWDASANLATSNPGSNVVIFNSNNSGGTNVTIMDVNGNWNSAGAVTAGANGTNTGYFQVGQYAGSVNYPASPAAGMIVFDNTTNHFYGYNGTSWVAFTGP